MTSGLVFGFDGVLVDSLIADSKIWCEVLLDYGYSGSSEELLPLISGSSPNQFLELVSQKIGYQIGGSAIESYDSLLSDRSSLFQQADAKITDILGSLQVPYAIVSNSSSSTVSLKAEYCGISQFINTNSFGSDLHLSPKPEPDLFLLAANYLGLEPGDCLAIEDTATGVEAGKKAGMDVVGLSAVDQFKDLRGHKADFTISDIKHLPVIIEALTGKSMGLEICV